MTLDTSWLRRAIPLEEGADLTAQLVSIRSYPGEEGAVQRAVAAWLERHGMQPLFMATEGDRPNVIARIENGPGPTLLLNGHVDTVLEARGWSGDPWTPRRVGDRLYGLGAFDMKCGVAAMLLAARALHERRDLWRGTLLVTSVVDEEAYSIGARALVESGISADYCVVTEPSWEKPVLGGVGKVLVRGEVFGKAAHGSWPQLGINAGVEAARLVAQLEGMPLGRHPRLHASQCLLGLHSGNEQYVITVPERATFTINRHIVPGETGATVLAEMRALANQLASPARFEFAIDPPYYPPWETSAEHPFVQHFARAYAAETGRVPEYSTLEGVADSNYFAADLGIPTIQFGPTGDGGHQADEWCDVPSIAAAARVLVRLAADVLR